MPLLSIKAGKMVCKLASRCLVSFGFAVVLASNSKIALGQVTLKKEEIVALPEYCQQSLHSGQATEQFRAHWGSALGPTFQHIHHYCFGMAFLSRALHFGLTRSQRQFNLERAVEEIEYVVRHAEPGFVLMPELLSRQGVALTQLKRYAAAEGKFQEAIAVEPNYWPAYRGLAEMYIDMKQPGRAREILQKGIPIVSDPRALQRLLDTIR